MVSGPPFTRRKAMRRSGSLDHWRRLSVATEAPLLSPSCWSGRPTPELEAWEGRVGVGRCTSARAAVVVGAEGVGVPGGVDAVRVFVATSRGVEGDVTNGE